MCVCVCVDNGRDFFYDFETIVKISIANHASRIRFRTGVLSAVRNVIIIDRFSILSLSSIVYPGAPPPTTPVGVYDVSLEKNLSFDRVQGRKSIEIIRFIYRVTLQVPACTFIIVIITFFSLTPPPHPPISPYCSRRFVVKYKTYGTLEV